ncbi:CzcE family metal-binding protein [Massilia soli]|uniref:CzcE family metal-binding protein n=1 Tax=Massilia soli TaxID=2792854 RepID=A0ABS7SV32_9BURK|nr:CzcE family metal-binding protein [Massilia soli]MBZ2209796.1 CzcE family metal-binding protein [Massilia soli]
MKTTSIAALSFLACLSISQTAAHASERNDRGAPTNQADERANRQHPIAAPFGYATNATPERVITVVRGKTRHINVTRLESVRIIDGDSSVTWMFDTLGLPSFSLEKILPGSTGITVYVDENPMYSG